MRRDGVAARGCWSFEHQINCLNGGINGATFNNVDYYRGAPAATIKWKRNCWLADQIACALIKTMCVFFFSLSLRRERLKEMLRATEIETRSECQEYVSVCIASFYGVVNLLIKLQCHQRNLYGNDSNILRKMIHKLCFLCRIFFFVNYKMKHHRITRE